MVYFKLFYSLLRKGWWYTSSIIDSNTRMCLATYNHPSYNFLAIFSDAPSSSTVISRCVALNFFCWISFLFFGTFLLINSIYLSFEPWAVESSVSPSILFLIFVIFMMLSMLVTRGSTWRDMGHTHRKQHLKKLYVVRWKNWTGRGKN